MSFAYRMSGPDLDPLKILLKELFEKVNFKKTKTSGQKACSRELILFCIADQNHLFEKSF